MNNKWKEKLKGSQFFLDLAIGFLCIVLLFSVIKMVQEFMYNYQVSYSANSFQYRLEEESYSNMVRMYYENQAANVKKSAQLQEYYAVALYFEAASYYKAYQETGDTARAQVQQEKMNECAENLGDFAFVRESIDEKLEIS